MKKSLLVSVFTMLFISTAAISGLPSEDPVVKNVRNRFDSGRVPEESDLLAKEFICTAMSARKGNFDKTKWENNLFFTKFDGYFVSHRGVNELFMEGMYFIKNHSDLIGVSGNYDYLSLRIDPQGYLIGEKSWVVNEAYKDIIVLDPIASSVPLGLKVSFYLLCVQK